MVFVAVGTQKQQFTRLFEKLENSKVLKDEEIIAQSGFTKFESKRIKMLGFIEEEKLKEYMATSDFVICHGGVGTIFSSLNMNKKVLVVPRLKKYNEHKNDHQLEICKELEKSGYILYLKENEDLDEKINELKKKEFKKYESNEEYLKVLKEVI